MFADVSLAEHAVLCPDVCVMWLQGAALAVRPSCCPFIQSDFLEADRGTGVPAAALSA